MSLRFSTHLPLVALSLLVCASAQSVSPLPPRDRNSTYFCGIDWRDSGKCTQKCPSGDGSECPSGEKCFADAECFGGPLPSASPFTSATLPPPEKETERGTSSTYFCGIDWRDSGKCTQKCPSGDSSECPSGETCFSGADCFDFPQPSAQPLASPGYPPSRWKTERADNSTYFCGTDWADSSKCTQKCPSGEDDECPSGETCFSDAQCVGPRPSASPSTTPSPLPPPPAKRTKSLGNEKESSTASLWKWLGPTIGAVSIATFALITVFCIRKQKKRALNDVAGEAV